MTEQTAQEKATQLQAEWDNFAANKRDATAKFEDEWRSRKVDIKEGLHEAIREMFRDGHGVVEVSRVTGNTNYTTLYKLRADVKVGTPRKITKPVEVSVPDAPSLVDVAWDYHDHVGTHGWLISTNNIFVKIYGSPGTPFDGEYAIATKDHEFVEGSESLLFSISARDFSKKVTLLTELLSGTYTKAVRLSDNPHKS